MPTFMYDSTRRHYEAAAAILDAIPLAGERHRHRLDWTDVFVRARDLESEYVPAEPGPVHRRGSAEVEVLTTCAQIADQVCRAYPELRREVARLMRSLHYAARRAAPAQVLEDAFQEGVLGVLGGGSHRTQGFMRAIDQDDVR